MDGEGFYKEGKMADNSIEVKFHGVPVWAAEADETDWDYSPGDAVKITIPFYEFGRRYLNTSTTFCERCEKRVDCLTTNERCKIEVGIGFAFLIGLIEPFYENMASDGRLLKKVHKCINKLQELYRELPGE